MTQASTQSRNSTTSTLLSASKPSLRQTLRYKATMLAIALGTLPVVITSSVAYTIASQTITKQIITEQTLRAQVASTGIDQFLVGRKRDIEALALNPLLADPSLQATPEQQEKAIAAFFSTVQYFDSIIFFDVQGNPIAQAASGRKFTGNYSDRSYFQEALQSGKPTMNGPGISSSSGKLRVEFAVPVKHAQTGETIAMIRARVPGEYINVLFRGLEGTGDGWYLVNEEGTLFAGSDKAHLSQDAEQELPGVSDLIESGQAGSGIFTLSNENRDEQEEPVAADADEFTSAMPEELLLTFVPVEMGEDLPSKDMSLLVFTDTALSLKPQAQLAKIFAIGTGFAGLVSVVIALLLAKRLNDPILKLTNTARTIAQEGRLELRVPVTSNDELGSLANSFNQLIEWVGLRTQDLEDSQLDLEQRTQELSAIINSLGDGLLVIDESKTITRFNPPLLRMFSKDANTIANQPIATVFGSDINALIEQSQTDICRTFSSEIELANNNIGQALTSTVIDPETKQPTGCVVLIRDITAEKEVDRMKTDFISTVSHELRTPLTSVLGFAKIIQKKLETVVIPAVVSDDKKTKRATRQVKDNLKIIVSEGERLTALINDVLDIAKIEAGKIEWRMTEVSPQAIVEQAIAATSVLAQNNNIAITLDAAPDLPNITGDQDRLIQVIINLISNAIKFTDEGSVTCLIKTTEDELRISIIDTGKGIRPEDQTKVFEKFQQVGEIMTDKPQGTGLGLPICKQIVEHHHGRIWVESEFGVGSTFTVALPLGSTTQAAKTPNITTQQHRTPTVEELVRQLKADVKQTTAAKASEPKIILVVDDENNIRRLLRQELETEGYQVEEAKDGVAALATIKRLLPDLIITDVMMPRLDGFDLTAVLKTNPDTANIPTIILSIVEDRDRGFRLGVDRYLTKPIDIAALLANIEALLTHKTSRSKVLVVNRDASTSATLTEVLLSKGYVVAEARSGQEGLDKARSIKPDMMIVDAALSEEHNIVKTLRFEKGLENISVILMESIEQTIEDTEAVREPEKNMYGEPLT
ncbi:MAG: response regulator [Cyanobacteria bacterium J06573_11]